MSAVVFTCGDINGIGPEIVIKTINKYPPNSRKKIIFICPQNIFENICKTINPKFDFIIKKTIPTSIPSNKVIVIDIGKCQQKVGRVTENSGAKSYKAIEKACEFAKDGIVDAIVTAPISKDAFSKANVKYPGHTELLADYFSVKNYAMMFVSDSMKAGLITIHIPIKHVHQQITKNRVQNTIHIIYKSLIKDFGLLNPKIAVLGLNPHAGENGKIGFEESKIIKPILDKEKYLIEGPFVPDAYFGNKLYKNYDCTIGMYHDQILIPFKLLNFNRGVNFTAGLPIVRTSPDHGTAFDIAGMGIAKPDSMMESYKHAIKIVNNRKSQIEISPTI